MKKVILLMVSAILAAPALEAITLINNLPTKATFVVTCKGGKSDNFGLAPYQKNKWNGYTQGRQCQVTSVKVTTHSANVWNWPGAEDQAPIDGWWTLNIDQKGEEDAVSGEPWTTYRLDYENKKTE
jgi:hypothetical protein